MSRTTSRSHDLFRLSVQCVRAAFFPFAASVAIMIIGCPLGVPLRFPFDFINVALQMSYVTSIVYLVRGAPAGLHEIGLAVPRMTASGLKRVLSIVRAAAWMLALGMAALAVLILALLPGVAALDNIVVTVVSRVGPMYLFCTLLGGMIGAGFVKMRATPPFQAP